MSWISYAPSSPDAAVLIACPALGPPAGPSLVPLLTLGVPGSPTAAVLLGGLLIHGLFPGAALFTIHAQVTWTFIGSLLLGQVLMMVFGLYISRHSRFVMRIPKHYMAAAVTVPPRRRASKQNSTGHARSPG